jgi:hypothetical protein
MDAPNHGNNGLTQEDRNPPTLVGPFVQASPLKLDMVRRKPYPSLMQYGSSPIRNPLIAVGGNHGWI